MNSQKLRSILLLAICFLLFVFVLQAKTAVYDAHVKVTPTTASKLWADGHKWEAPSISSSTVILFWMASLFLLALSRRPERRACNVRQTVYPRLSSRQHLERFLRPPPNA